MLNHCLEWYKWVLTNFDHDRQWFMLTLIPLSHAAVTVDCISRFNDHVRLILRYTTVDIHCRDTIGGTSETVEEVFWDVCMLAVDYSFTSHAIHYILVRRLVLPFIIQLCTDTGKPYQVSWVSVEFAENNAARNFQNRIFYSRDGIPYAHVTHSRIWYQKQTCSMKIHVVRYRR